MKKILLIAFTLFQLKAAAQDVIYLNDGTMLPGKMAEINDDKVKFKNMANPTGPLYSRSSGSVQIAFNAAGDYLVFAQAKPFTDKEKEDFINPVFKSRPFDIVVDVDGNILPVNIADENDNEIAAYDQGKDVKLPKTNLVFIIRKDGTHQLFSSPELALPYLAIDKAKINSLLFPSQAANQQSFSSTPPAPAVTNKATSAHHDDGDYVVPDIALFGTKALQKTQEFTGYLQAVASVSTDRDAATKSINLACGLFLNEEARVEVSSVSSAIKNKYKIRDYLNRLMIRSGQYDKVQIEYANINYASKFKKGADGNYYGSVTFVQKFQGFVDGNLVYGDKTKRNVTIVLKHYEKAVNGETVSGWDVFLDDIGVVETKKI
jgi:hypothetical protein